MEAWVIFSKSATNELRGMLGLRLKRIRWDLRSGDQNAG
jgi:hypothetical protein